MARRRKGDSGTEESIAPDMTPLIDVCFQLITFFVMIMTIAKDEQAEKIRLPVAQTPALIEEEGIPDSININVNKDARCMSWGLEIDLNTEAGWALLDKRLAIESAISRRSGDPAKIKEEGLPTTLILRIDYDVDYEIFRKVMDACRKAKFTKYQLKAKEREA